MPIIVYERRYNDAGNPSDGEHFARVLQDNPDALALLNDTLGQSDYRLFEGVFNDKPVAMALLKQQGSDWRLAELVVHPATRSRGVGKEVVRQLRRLEPQLQLPSSE